VCTEFCAHGVVTALGLEQLRQDLVLVGQHGVQACDLASVIEGRLALYLQNDRPSAEDEGLVVVREGLPPLERHLYLEVRGHAVLGLGCPHLRQLAKGEGVPQAHHLLDAFAEPETPLSPGDAAREAASRVAVTDNEGLRLIPLAGAHSFEEFLKTASLSGHTVLLCRVPQIVPASNTLKHIWYKINNV